MVFALSRIIPPRRLPVAVAFALGLAAAGVGCGSSSSSDQKSQVAGAMQRSMSADLTALYHAAMELQAAAPTPVGRGWDATADATAIATMKAAWVRARTAYEHVEGATAPIFPDLDVSIDERYDGFLTDLHGAGDADAFDGKGVTGMHAIERILYAGPGDAVPPSVVAFESALPGYRPAAYPASEAEAAELKTGICARLVADSKLLLDQWTPQEIDVSGAFQGLVGLMNEQQEKVNKASTGEEESRYSQHTMADLHANLEGTKKIYALFSAWLTTRPAPATPAGALSGAAVDASINAGFAQLSAVYAAIPGDAIPTPPATWSAEAPSAADLQSPFGTLYASAHQAVDPTVPGSIVALMNQGAALLDIPVLRPE